MPAQTSPLFPPIWKPVPSIPSPSSPPAKPPPPIPRKPAAHQPVPPAAAHGANSSRKPATHSSPASKAAALLPSLPRLLNKISKTCFQKKVGVSYQLPWAHREGGEIPPRTRRCDGHLWSRLCHCHCSADF